MIKLFYSDYSYNEKKSQLKSVNKILDKLDIPYQVIKHERSGTSWDIRKVLNENLNKLDTDDLIILDNYSHFDGNPYNVLSDFPNLQFLIFAFDRTDISNQDLYYNTNNRNYKVVSPEIFDISKIHSFNYYSWNYVNSDDFKISKYLFDSFNLNLKNKKFIAPIGYIRWDRLLTYDMLNVNNHIKDGWVSISTKFNYGDNDYSYLKHQLESYTDVDINGESLNNLLSKIPFSFDRQLDSPSDIEYSIQNSRLELIHRHNSYIGIVNDTAAENKNTFYTSEKLWKPFCTFQFPFIIGNQYCNEFLKDIGFDLFDDIFEIDDINLNLNTHDLIKYQLEKLNVFLSKPNEEIHHIYSKFKHRLVHNYNIMKVYSEHQEINLKKYLNNNYLSRLK